MPLLMRLLVSVRDEAEALLAAQGGANFIDLKEPREGALGGLPVARVRAVVQALRRRGIGLPISATIGDLSMDEFDRIAAGVDAVAACGVDYVKVGIERAPEAAMVLDRLAASGAAIVPVFIADRGLDAALVAHACALNFPALMADTADKLSGSLFDCVSAAELQRFVRSVRQAGKLVGLAGALRVSHLPALRELRPDFAGFRSAVCAGERASALDATRLRARVAACGAHSGPSIPQA
ncbi:MAG TPA: (5-formylfuran-3-yl)methyl phosphate synthase, partial [Rhizobacter sp.]|nr:(5-formylfuran-3-yl)methyl phosphate synthase [Rhizobacter sp.]